MVQDFLEEGRGDVLTKSHAPNLAGEHKPDFAATHFLIQFHRLLKLIALCFAESQLGWKAGAPEKFRDPLNIRMAQTKSLRRKTRCGDLANRNCLAMKISAVTGYRFECVADCMTEI